MNDIMIPLVMGFLLVGAGALFIGGIIGFSILLADLIRYIHDRWVQ